MDIGFIRVCCSTLASQVVSECRAWVSAISATMATIDANRLDTLQAKIQEFQAGLRVAPEDLDTLKGVLATIADVRGQGMVVELEFRDLSERYRTRVLYAGAGEERGKAEEGVAHVAGVWAVWRELEDEADVLDAELQETKDRFSVTT